MKKIDRDALERAMMAAGAEPGRAEQLADKLASGEPWAEVAKFASYCAQCRALRLKPWENPPSCIDRDDDGDHDAAGRTLLRRMLKAGLSEFEPDPLAALALKEG